MYQIFNCFQFVHSVRIFYEILTDLAKITHLFLTPKLCRFGTKTIPFWALERRRFDHFTINFFFKRKY
jgi:hypothetical protein